MQRNSYNEAQVSDNAGPRNKKTEREYPCVPVFSPENAGVGATLRTSHVLIENTTFGRVKARLADMASIFGVAATAM